MPVAAQDDDALGTGISNQVIKPLSLVRKVHPLLEAVVLRDDLDAGNQQPHLGRHAKLLAQPAPLGITQNRGRRIGVAVIGIAVFVRLFPLEPAAEITRIEQDHLHALAFGAEDLCVIDPRAMPARRVSRVAEEVEEDLLRLVFLGIIAAGVVGPEVVIVPGGEDRARSCAVAESPAWRPASRTWPASRSCRACRRRCCRRAVAVSSGRVATTASQIGCGRAWVAHEPNAIRPSGTAAGALGCFCSGRDRVGDRPGRLRCIGQVVFTEHGGDGRGHLSLGHQGRIRALAQGRRVGPDDRDPDRFGTRASRHRGQTSLAGHRPGRGRSRRSTWSSRDTPAATEVRPTRF